MAVGSTDGPKLIANSRWQSRRPLGASRNSRSEPVWTPALNVGLYLHLYRNRLTVTSQLNRVVCTCSCFKAYAIVNYLRSLSPR